MTDISEKLIKYQEIKPNIKQQYLSEEARLMFYQYLTQNPETWPTQQETDEQCKETIEISKNVKEKIEEEKTQIEALLEIGEEGSILLQKNIEDMEKKLSQTEQKIKRAENIQRQYEDKLKAMGENFPTNKSLEQVILEKKEQIAKLDTEIQRGKVNMEAMLKQIQTCRNLVNIASKRIQNERAERLKHNKQSQVQNYLAKEETANLRQLLQEMQRLSEIEECPAEGNQIKIKFVTQTQTESQLYLTMTLCQDQDGRVMLSQAEVNIPTFNCSDLIQSAVKTNDVRSLVTRLRDRWNSYYPIMTEIEQVSECHAVDWIQDEGLVRILVGKGGTIMYSLKMPTAYPFSGEITVANTSGLPSEISLEDSLPPFGTKTLKEWVDFLEEKFGKP